MHTKGFSLAAALLGLLGASSAALAQQNLYAGADIGNFDTENLLGHCTTQKVDSCPDSVPYIRVKAGVQANEMFAVEGHFAWTQRMTATDADNPANTSASSQLEYTSYGLAGVARAELLQGTVPGLYGFGRIGLHMWELESGVSGTGQGNRDKLEALAEDGTDLMYGVGVQYLMSDRMVLEGGYDEYNGGLWSDMSGFRVGMSYSF
ncbi:MAG: outer membrane beta-barrel protein [Betaproteobacteria bacterium AqS2]|uniref:Outer membrane beta-barrel protein n=1 Tax=Candidatus Amphirhobacter heronislandensis TaxID=1732024 RepID=A0A930UE13_9GAMM|nr:outer membrane beta-barrel protein [Betaproteobacteria bacterium AqS2]